MLTILRGLVSKAGWLLVSFLGIVLVLALWNELPAKLGDWRSQAIHAEKVAGELYEGAPAFNLAARNAVREADAEIAVLRGAGKAQLAAAERDVARRRKDAESRVLDGKGIALAAATGRTDRIVASYQAQLLELPLLDRTEKLIRARRANLHRQAQIEALEGELASHQARVTAFNKQVATRNRLQRQARAQQRDPLCRRASMLPGCGLVRDIDRRDEWLRDRRPALRSEGRELRARKAAMNDLVLVGENVADGAAIAAAASQNYAAGAQALSRSAGGYAWNRARDALRRYGGTAFWILLGAVLLPVVHKLFAFSVIAPLAARSRPVRLRDEGPPLVASASGISLEVPIDRDSELLLRSGLQSTAADIRGGDKYVLDWSMPFSCLAAGLVNLQRLRSDRADHVVVTGTDGDHRVALITVPAEGAVVLQPRALLGVVKPVGQKLLITRPWRICRLISWITAQFRYVVFHGPCALIVQGRDGVQVEEAARGRMINKRLTLGFDAGLAYGAARSASFLPYLRGEASLFNDRFEGAGRYLYEQRSAGSGKGGVWGRGLRGIGDAVLKAFGI